MINSQKITDEQSISSSDSDGAEETKHYPFERKREFNNHENLQNEDNNQTNKLRPTKRTNIASVISVSEESRDSQSIKESSEINGQILDMTGSDCDAHGDCIYQDQ